MGNRPATIATKDGKSLLRSAIKTLKAGDFESIQKLFDSHAKLNDETGVNCVSRAEFDSFFRIPGILGAQLFDVFDTDHNDSIDFEEFIFGLNICSNADSGKKIEYRNGDDQISPQELSEFLQHLVKSSLQLRSIVSAEMASASASSTSLTTPKSSSYARVSSFLSPSTAASASSSSSSASSSSTTKSAPPAAAAPSQPAPPPASSSSSNSLSAIQTALQLKEIDTKLLKDEDGDDLLARAEARRRAAFDMDIPAVVSAAFKYFDTSRNGTLSVDEFRHWVESTPQIESVMNMSFAVGEVNEEVAASCLETYRSQLAQIKLRLPMDTSLLVEHHEHIKRLVYDDFISGASALDIDIHFAQLRAAMRNDFKSILAVNERLSDEVCRSVLYSLCEKHLFYDHEKSSSHPSLSAPQVDSLRNRFPFVKAYMEARQSIMVQYFDEAKGPALLPVLSEVLESSLAVQLPLLPFDFIKSHDAIVNAEAVAKLKKLQAEADQKNSASKRQLDEAHEQIKSLQDVLAEKISALVTSEEKVHSIEAKLKEYKNSTVAFKRQIEEQENKIETLEERVKQAAQDQLQLDRLRLLRKTETEEWSNSLQASQTEITRLKTQILEQQQQLLEAKEANKGCIIC